MTFADVMRAYPHLTRVGFWNQFAGKPFKHECERVYRGSDFRVRRHELLAETDVDKKVERCAAWLRENIEARRQPCRPFPPAFYIYSYFGGETSNGVICAAALIAGFDIETRGWKNWGAFKWSAKSWREAHDAMDDQRQAAKQAGATRLQGSYRMPVEASR